MASSKLLVDVTLSSETLATDISSSFFCRTSALMVSTHRGEIVERPVGSEEKGGARGCVLAPLTSIRLVIVAPMSGYTRQRHRAD